MHEEKERGAEATLFLRLCCEERANNGGQIW
jgi:hypothetical protein